MGFEVRLASCSRPTTILRAANFIENFRAQSMPERSVAGFCEMFQGFNSGLIVFEGTHETRRGPTTLTEALESMVLRSAAEIVR